ncbi:ABC transporter permease [Streptomyces chumphonensis]|uniref:ABC transporter permease n=1 Tax=Streptomyces chumphonensis TaxID=1214925 RepID=A0A927IE47_9ACTN|nr:ABC transporter permease [Streptomyces chumphonensis]MBD3933570.1 ABC transporter permease [Streptomyces chumphonensis]
MIRTWLRELGLGVRFAAGGGRSGWARTALTAAGVGVGVAVLLLAASVPTVLDGSEARSDARQPVGVMGEDAAPPGPTTTLMAWSGTTFRDTQILGRLLQADGDREEAVRPPGVAHFPAPGELVVSPALREMLETEGELLSERFRGTEIVGTIGPEGLKGPGEPAYYLGADGLDTDNAWRVTELGMKGGETPLDPALVVLLVVMLSVLLMPIVVFVATAVRFGGERRDRRLAALRLVGADIAMTRRIAAGEVLFASLLGLVVGALLFLVGRELVEGLSISTISVYTADIVPVWWLGAVIVMLVPVIAVAVTLAALRGVAIGPLGVFREGTTRRRRVWWRLLLLAVGVAMLVYFGPDDAASTVNEWGISAGVLLMLCGITALLPWAVERAVTRMRGGPLSWQLATRRLQLNSGMAARAVSGVTVAVAGAVALHMLFAAVETQQRVETGHDTDRAQAVASRLIDEGAELGPFVDRYATAEGVTSALGLVRGWADLDVALDADGNRPGTSFQIGDCRVLRELIEVEACADGDVFVVPSPDREALAPGDRLDLAGPVEASAESAPSWWTVPAAARETHSIPGPHGDQYYGVFATPSALDVSGVPSLSAVALLDTVPGDEDVVEHLRNLAGVQEWNEGVHVLANTRLTSQFATIRNALFVGAVVIMLMIAASMVVSTLEQLRERKRQLSVLVAFGTRRGTLGASVLWQTAVPVGIGLALASAGGTALGVLLLDMVGAEVTDWLAFLPLTAAGLGMILLVTVASLPMLWRMMRPDGLRTE